MATILSLDGILHFCFLCTPLRYVIRISRHNLIHRVSIVALTAFYNVPDRPVVPVIDVETSSRLLTISIWSKETHTVVQSVAKLGDACYL